MSVMGRLSAIIALLALLSCADEQPIEEVPPITEETPIAFSSMLQDEQAATRAGTPLNNYATIFTVWGVKNTDYNDTDGYTDPQQVFPGYRVKWTTGSAYSTTTNTHGWEYVNQQIPGKPEQTVKYWDWSATAYRFMAVTGTDAVAETSETAGSSGTIQYYDITFTANAEGDTPYYSHLWFSNGSDAYVKRFGQPVQLEFLQPLSKVRFMFTFEDPSKAAETTLTDKSFHPTDGGTIKQKGQVTVSYPLTGTSTTETLTVSDAAGGRSALEQDYYESVTKTGEHVTSPYYDAAETPLSNWYTVLPTPDGQSSYTLQVSVDGEPKSTVVPAEYMTWLPGYEYTYIFKIHVDGSVSIDNVQSAFTSWKEHTATKIVYNW